MSSVLSLSGFVSSTQQNPQLGTLPVGAYVIRVQLHVTQAFNSGGTDNIRVGHATDDDAYGTDTDVSTTGIKTVTAGTGVGYDTVARAVDATYTNGGGEPTTGTAHVILEYVLLRQREV